MPLLTVIMSTFDGRIVGADGLPWWQRSQVLITIMLCVRCVYACVRVYLVDLSTTQSVERSICAIVRKPAQAVNSKIHKFILYLLHASHVRLTTTLLKCERGAVAEVDTMRTKMRTISHFRLEISNM